MKTRFLRIAVLLSVASTPHSADVSVQDPTGKPVPSEPVKAPETPRQLETVLVMPFENAGRGAKFDWLGEGLAELTIERLAGEGLVIFPREERVATLEKLGLPASPYLSRATMLKVANEIDADHVVFGQYISDGKTLRISARILRTDPPELTAAIEESDALEGLMDTHARLAWRVLSRLMPTYPVSQQDFAQKVGPLRLDAFEHYIRALLIEPGKDEHRIRLLREAARLEPAWVDPLFALGQAYFARRDCDSALLWLSRVPPAHSRGLEAGFAAGVCHLLRNDAARAETAFTALLDQVRASAEEELPEVLNNLAVAQARLGNWREAAGALERATQLDPEEPDYWFNRGLVGLRANEPAAAAQAFRESLRRQSGNVEARALLVAALERSGQASAAAADRAALPPEPRLASLLAARPEALAGLERVKMRLDIAFLYQLHEASEVARAAGAALLRRPQRLQLHLSRGRQFLVVGELDAAQREFARAVVLAPLNSPAAHMGLAEVYRRQGRAEDAIRELRAALASREDTTARLVLTRLYMELKRDAEAREELRLILKFDPDNAEARQLLEQVEARAGSGGPG